MPDFRKLQESQETTAGNHSCLKRELGGLSANTLRNYKVSWVPFAKFLCLFTFAEDAIISYMCLLLVDSKLSYKTWF